MLAIENENLTKSFYIASSISGKIKKLKHTPGSLSYRTKVTRCRETIVECNTIHDGSVENKKILHLMECLIPSMPNYPQ